MREGFTGGSSCMRDQEMMHAPLPLNAACDRQFSRAARQARLTLELGR
jgi:hypothetical protein